MRDVKYICNVEAAIWHGDRWLLIERGPAMKHAPGTLALVGGKLERADDMLENALRREVEEEIGLRLGGELHYVASGQFDLASGQPVMNIVFATPYTGGDLVVNEREVARYLWMGAREIADWPAVPPWTKRYVALAETVRTRLCGSA